MERKVKLQITGMEKKYKNGDGVENINIDVYEGEFVTMLGPSGCGKSTILRTLGGFLDIDKGDILIDGESVKDLPPEKRPTAMVFQSYNLWPHMTVYENLAFGLEIKKVPKNEIKSEVERGLKLVNMTGYEKKYPGQLSGGQQQRIAIARALLLKPSVLLLDEPFSALDENLREDMRNLVLQLQREFHMTVILVTHDREEALSMSDRIALMFSGRLVQTGTPKEVYLRPESRLAADYFGDCVYINGTISGGRFTGGGLDCPVPFLSQEFISQAIPSSFDSPVPGPSVPDGPCRLMLRPGSLEPDRTGGYFLTVEQVSFRGGSVLVSLRSDDGALWKKAFSGPVDLAPGDRIQASVRTQDGVLFPV